MKAGGPGRVSLVGAGPGDPELLTLRAVRAIAAADVVMIDDLVDRRVLEHARPGARVVEVGKRGGCASTPQDFIERLMLAEALAGSNVARVKGGDPFVFGRGGEERQWLLAHGVEVDVVPGISSGMAAPAAIGVPVTHRDAVRGVAFVTGHPGPGVQDADWEALARSGLTLVVYMGVARVATIRDRLLAGGLPAATPAAVVQHATLPHQRSLVTTLGALAEDLAASGLGSPAVIVIGEVVRLGDMVRDGDAARHADVRATAERMPRSASIAG